MNGANDRTEDDVRHRTMMGLLGAYADDEIAGSVKADIENHLQRAEECRRELRIQVALRNRLLAEEPASSPAVVLQHLEAHLHSLGSGALHSDEPSARAPHPEGASPPEGSTPRL